MPRRTTSRPSGTTAVQLSGVISHGAPIHATDELVILPADRIGPGELVFRLGSDLLDAGLAAGDLLIVEPRARAATGEFVIVTLGDDAFIGRYWKKHGARSLLDGAFHVIAQGSALRVLGAVTLIVRVETR